MKKKMPTDRNAILLGHGAASRPVWWTSEAQRRSHLLMVGGTGTGKTKMKENILRQRIRSGQGSTDLDWHGSSFHDMLSWCAWHDLGLLNDPRRLLLVDPTQDRFVTPLNFFSSRGIDISTQVSRRIAALVRIWAQRNADALPTGERILRQIFYFCVERRESIVNAVRLLNYGEPELRRFAAATTEDSRTRLQWEWLLQMTNREWNETVLSAENRMTRLVASPTLRRFLGVTQGCLDIRRVMDAGATVLVNLGESGFFTREQARTFVSLFLNEYLEVAMARANERRPRPPRHHMLLCDEFQAYLDDSSDIGAMLEQCRKGGLTLALATQHLGPLVDSPRLKKSIFSNCRNIIAFGSLDFEDAAILAQELKLSEINRREVKSRLYRTLFRPKEETRTIRSWSRSTSHSSSRSEGRSSSSSSGSGSSSGVGSGGGNSFPLDDEWFGPVDGGVDRGSANWSEFSGSSEFASRSDGRTENHTEGGGESESHGETTMPFLKPIESQELASETDWTRDEKVSRAAEAIKHPPERHCLLRLDSEPTQQIRVLNVRRRFINPRDLLEYEAGLYRRQQSLSGREADRLLIDSEQTFLEQARNHAQVEIEVRPGGEVPLRRRRRRP